MHQQSTKLQGRLAIVRERRADCQTVASDCLGFLIVACARAPLNLTHATRVLLELGLGVPVGLGDRFGSFLEIMELAQLVRDSRQDLLHRQTDRAVRIRNDGVDRHRQGILHLAQQISEIVLSSALEAAGKQDFAREAIAQHPEHVLCFEGVESINSQDDVALSGSP
jgi:hypothetical protein